MRGDYLYLAILLYALPGLSARASHILGGEIQMQTTSDANRFLVTMLQFWDETKLTVANRDPTVEVLFYRKRDNTLVYRTSLPYISSRKIIYPNRVCTNLRSLNTQEGTYMASVFLEPAAFNDPEGYYIVWERCCRNAAISNILSPGSSGLVFYLEFPPLSIRNSSPVFDFPNGDYICKDTPYSMALSARDADGDELRYSLVTPLRGNTNEGNPLGDDSPKLGYPLVQWAPGISAQAAVPGTPGLSINTLTGQITVVASQLGLYLFAVQCEEYRNGKRIGLVRRDFQSLVIECNSDPVPIPMIFYGQQPAPPIVEVCDGSAVRLETREIGDWLYQWKFNGQDIPGANSLVFLAADTGDYSLVKSPAKPGQGQCSQASTSSIVKLVAAMSPTATIGKNNTIVCEDGKIDLQASIKRDYSYQWLRGDSILTETSAVLSVEEAGNYFLIVREEKTGCTAQDSILIKMDSLRITLPAQVVVQRGSRIELQPTVRSTASVVGYNWFPPIGLSSTENSNPYASPDQTTDYTLTVKTNGGCKTTAGIKVIVTECGHPSPPAPTVLYDQKPAPQTIEICEGRAILLQTQKTNGGVYQWQRNGQDIPGETAASISVKSIGTYALIQSFEGASPCEKSVISQPVELVRGTLPTATISKDDKVLCLGGKLNLAALNNDFYAYTWMKGPEKLEEDGSVLSVNRAGTFHLLVFDKRNGCSSQDSIQISGENIDVDLPGEIYFPRGKSVLLKPQVNSSSNPVVYNWSPSIGLSSVNDSLPMASPAQTTVYTLEVASPNGCIATDSVRVVVIDRLFIPDAFSPNGDGINDVLEIKNGEALILNIRIYNRWGEVVFVEEGYGIPWDGRYKGAFVLSGTYGYVIITQGYTYSGTILLIE